MYVMHFLRYKTADLSVARDVEWHAVYGSVCQKSKNDVLK
jgi:hypothetical protein